MTDSLLCAHCRKALTGRYVVFGSAAYCNWLCVNARKDRV